MAFAVLQKIAECINWENSKVINALSKHRMTIYLFHQQIIYLLAEIDVGDKLFIDVFINSKPLYFILFFNKFKSFGSNLNLVNHQVSTPLF